MTCMTHAMVKGSNVPLDAMAVRAVLRWTPGAGIPDVDASALLLGAAWAACARTRTSSSTTSPATPPAWYDGCRSAASPRGSRTPSRPTWAGWTPRSSRWSSPRRPTAPHSLRCAICASCCTTRRRPTGSRSRSSTCGRRPARRRRSSAASSTGAAMAGNSGPWGRDIRPGWSAWRPPSASRSTRPRRRSPNRPRRPRRLPRPCPGSRPRPRSLRRRPAPTSRPRSSTSSPRTAIRSPPPSRLPQPAYGYPQPAAQPVHAYPQPAAAAAPAPDPNFVLPPQGPQFVRS